MRYQTVARYQVTDKRSAANFSLELRAFERSPTATAHIPVRQAVVIGKVVGVGSMLEARHEDDRVDICATCDIRGIFLGE
jgi:hypothetical protein